MIQVYGIRIDRSLSEEERSAAIEYLTPERKAKALRFRRLKDQEKGILTGLLEDYVIRRELSRDDDLSVLQKWKAGASKWEEMTDSSAQLYKIQHGKEGKPYIVEYPDIQYNISHAGDWIVCGIGDEVLGIDIEREERYSRRVVERFFHPEEQEDIFSQDSEEKEQEIFARYWVMKESFMKLSGAGFSVPIQSFHCDRRNGEIRVTEDVPEEWMQWLRAAGLREDRRPVCRFLDVAPGYQCAVCTLPAAGRREDSNGLGSFHAKKDRKDLFTDHSEKPAFDIQEQKINVRNVSEILEEYGIPDSLRSTRHQSEVPDRSGKSDC